MTLDDTRDLTVDSHDVLEQKLDDLVLVLSVLLPDNIEVGALSLNLLSFFLKLSFHFGDLALVLLLELGFVLFHLDLGLSTDGSDKLTFLVEGFLDLSIDSFLLIKEYFDVLFHLRLLYF